MNKFTRGAVAARAILQIVRTVPPNESWLRIAEFLNTEFHDVKREAAGERSLGDNV
jgi:hypothetical protein